MINLITTFTKPGFPNCKNEADAMTGAQVLKEFKECNERKVP